jgi:hypothetical protein
MEEINLQTLYEQQDYETLVKRTAALSDLNMIRYHVIGLLGIGANQMVLRVMLAKFSIIQKALVIFLKIHYEVLTLHREYPEHEDLMAAYDQLPYSSQDVEEWVSKIYILYRKPPHPVVKEIIDLFLEAYEKKDEGLLVDLVTQLKPIHVYQLRATLKDILLGHLNQHLKGLIVLTLIHARFDEVIQMSKGDQTLSFNPIDTSDPFDDGTFDQFKQMIDEGMKDPSIRHISYSILSTYILKMIPFEIDVEFYFIQAIRMLTYEYVRLPVPKLDFSEDDWALIDQKKKHIEEVLKT